MQSETKIFKGDIKVFLNKNFIGYATGVHYEYEEPDNHSIYAIAGISLLQIRSTLMMKGGSEREIKKYEQATFKYKDGLLLCIEIEYVESKAAGGKVKASYYNSTKAGEEALRLVDLVPGLSAVIDSCPEKNCKHQHQLPQKLFDRIIQLNDRHKWSRDEIADWVETLDLDIDFKTGEQNEQD